MIDPTTPSRHLKTAAAMLLALIIPFAITLSTVKDPAQPPDYASDPTPLGYTWSLTIFLIPILFLVVWFVRHPRYHVERKAYWLTILAILLLGAVLDMAFGYSFFYFPNTGAVTGIRIPAFDWSTLSWAPAYLPIEEFGFYLLGGCFIVTLYLWGMLYWFDRYSHENHKALCQATHKIVHVDLRYLLIALALVVLGIVIKKTGPYPEIFPGYFTFIVLIAFLPTMLLMKSLQNLINWRALMFMVFVLLAMSLVYEATLGVPYGWWKYHTEQMLGILIGAWSYLPIEAVMIWLVIGFITILIYEAFRVFLYMERSAGEALFGRKE